MTDREQFQQWSRSVSDSTRSPQQVPIYISQQMLNQLKNTWPDSFVDTKEDKWEPFVERMING